MSESLVLPIDYAFFPMAQTMSLGKCTLLKEMALKKGGCVYQAYESTEFGTVYHFNKGRAHYIMCDGQKASADRLKLFFNSPETDDFLAMRCSRTELTETQLLYHYLYFASVRRTTFNHSKKSICLSGVDDKGENLSLFTVRQSDVLEVTFCSQTPTLCGVYRTIESVQVRLEPFLGKSTIEKEFIKTYRDEEERVPITWDPL
ncbi:MAG: hypothetical protein ACPGUD_07860 [Parashewanella sp.]